MTEERKAKIISLYRDHGLTCRALKERFKIKPIALREILSEAGISPDPHRQQQANAGAD